MAACQYCNNTHLLPVLIITIILFPFATPLTFDFEQFGDDDPNLKLEGDVYYDKGFLQLTRYNQDSLGRVTYYKNLHLWDRNSGKVTDFSTRFSFIINSSNINDRGDGITFFLAPPNFPLPVPRDGSGIGLVSRRQLEEQSYTNENPFVAVEFDTFYNDWDPPYDHVGIDVKSISTAYTTRWFSIKDGRRYDADIIYNSSSNNLSVIFHGYQNNTAVEQNLYELVNLTEVLPEWVEFGFSSATGDYYEIHTLCSWSFNSSLDIEDLNNKSKNGLAVGNKSKKGLAVGLSIGSGVLTLICVMGLTWLLIWKMRRRSRGTDRFDFNANMGNDFERNAGLGPKKFSYKHLVTATNSFAEEQKLGEGGFGGVYKGYIRDLDSYVAIKKVSQGSKQGWKEFASEVKIISQLRHKNLVQLIGWCHEKNDLMLVYEFLENGSLDSHLFKGKSVLTWEVRYNIAAGLASALLYLHEECERCVVHRDIKSSNVMLDTNFNAKLGDFGLARLLDHGKEFKTTVLAGTLGYMAPEYATKGKASRESDVYSFGVVALEIACGRKPIEPKASEERVCLVDWVWELYSMHNNLLEAADQRLCGDFDEQQMLRLMTVGLWCAHPDYLLRSTIRQAAQVLNFEAPLPTLPSQWPAPTSFSSFSSSTSASGINRTLPSINSFVTGSSQSSTSIAVISPSSALLNTY